MELEYKPEGGDFYHRVAMCQHLNEGCELEDAVLSLASILRGIGLTDEAEEALKLAENLCRDYILCLVEQDDEQLDEVPEAIVLHFSDGKTKEQLIEEWQKHPR